jgi:5-methylcytosine-specific restriction endonuclease McrA
LLQRVENVYAYHERRRLGHLTGNGHVVVVLGKKRLPLTQKSHRSEFWQMITKAESFPVCFMVYGERGYWKYGDRWFWDNEALTADQVHALIVTRDQRRQATISRAQSTVAVGQGRSRRMPRSSVPEDLKLLVWTRDEGRCRQCGSNVELQFDHIIPQSLGGATSAENLQILCGPCNRLKGASVASPRVEAHAEPTPAAGWYPDPSEAGRQRYWDGNAWTSYTSP